MKLQKEISELDIVIANIQGHLVFLNSIEKLKPKMLGFIKNNQYSQFAQALLSAVYVKLTHEQKIKFSDFIADSLEKLNASTDNILQNLSLDNIDSFIKQFVTKFKNLPDR